MERDLNLEPLSGRDLNFRAVSIQKAAVGEMGSMDHRCAGGASYTPLVRRLEDGAVKDSAFRRTSALHLGIR